MCVRIFLLRLKEVFQNQPYTQTIAKLPPSQRSLPDDSASDSFYSYDSDSDDGSATSSTEPLMPGEGWSPISSGKTSDWEREEVAALGDQVLPSVEDVLGDELLGKDVLADSLPGDDLSHNDFPEILGIGRSLACA
jgi:hypothetical protein